MALTMMSSCSKDNDVTEVNNPDMPNEEAPVAIELGLSAPQAVVTTRGLGTVGGIKDEDNFWNGQELHVVMYDKGTTTKTTEGDPATYIFEGLTFKAPTQTTEDKTNTTIQILKGDATIQAKYYPSTGAYDFYGYHVDNAGGTLSEDAKTVTGIVIDGTQDLMTAKTKPVTKTSYPSATGITWDTDNENLTEDDQKKMFSAWAARRNIQPILVFNHLLTRLQFNVIAGQKDAAKFYYNGADWTENLSPASLPEDNENQNKSTAVFITGIKVTNVKTSDITIDLEGQTATSGAAEANQALILKGTVDIDPQDGNLDDLTPTAPEGFIVTGDDATHPTKTQVGESIMLLPGDAAITLEITVSQLVVDTENAANNEAITYTTKTETLKTTIKASDIKTTGSTTESANKATFEAGDSYNINITVYSFQRIEVSAELTAWEEGGDINIAPGDQF